MSPTSWRWGSLHVRTRAAPELRLPGTVASSSARRAPTTVTTRLLVPVGAAGATCDEVPRTCCRRLRDPAMIVRRCSRDCPTEHRRCPEFDRRGGPGAFWAHAPDTVNALPAPAVPAGWTPGSVWLRPPRNWLHGSSGTGPLLGTGR